MEKKDETDGAYGGDFSVGKGVLYIHAHSYGQPLLVRFSAQCIQRTGLCVL